MRSSHGIGFAACAIAALVFHVRAGAAPPVAAPDPATEALLDRYEKVASEDEAALRPFLASENAIVRSAADAAAIRIDAIRSTRRMLAANPATFKWNGGLDGSLAKWQAGVEYYLDCAKAGKDPFAGMLAGVRTLRSPIDGQLLFYKFTLPPDYDPHKKYPVSVDLHSGAALIWRALWMDGKPTAEPRAGSSDGAIHVSPDGRGNASYAGMGEVAVLDALSHLKAHYAVDPDRVRIGGASMGGTGALRFAAFYPDQFAAAHCLTGAADYGQPRGNPLIDPTPSIDNVANLAVCQWFEPGDLKGDRGVVCGRWIDEIASGAKAHPGQFPHRVFKDPNGKHGVIDRAMLKEGFDWVNAQVRNPFPRRVAYTTHTLRRDGAYWARIDTVEDPAKPERIEAELKDGGAIAVTTRNVVRFHLDLVHDFVGENAKLTVAIDGAPPLPAPVGTVYFARGENGWAIAAERYPRGLVKRHALSGPAMDVFMGEPVLIVYGTLLERDKGAREKRVDAIVDNLFGPGDGGAVLHTGFPRRADLDLTSQDSADYNLVLLGSPRQNSALHDMQDKLPVKFHDDGIEMAGKRYAGPDVGLILAYPNPLNPQRYVLILPENFADCTGQSYTDIYGYGDYVVGKPTPGWNGKHFTPLANGSFDATWQSPKPAGR